MATFGKTSIGGTGSALSAGNDFAIGPWTAPENGTIDSVSIYTDGTANIAIGVYTDSSVYPNAQVAATTGSISAGGGWDTFTISGPISSGQDYWIVFNIDASVTFAYDAVSGKHIYLKARTYDGTLPDPYPASATDVPTREYSGYITYTASSGTSGDGSAAGTSTASGEGKSTAVANGTAAGIATAVAAGTSTAEADGSSAGIAAASGEGKSTAVATGSAAGTSTAAGVSGSVISGDGSSTGSSAANGAGSSVVSATAAAAGIGSVAGSGKSTVVAAAVSAGLSAISAIGFATAAAIAIAAGVATVTGQSSVMSVSGPYRIAKAEAFVPTAVPQAFAGGAVKRQIFPGGAAAAQSEPQ